MAIKYIGKALVIEEGKERVLVIGDIHIGYGGVIRGGGVMGEALNKAMMRDLEEVFESAGKVNWIVLLGDLKNSFSRGEKGERSDIINLLDFLEEVSEGVVIIKGNHDNYIESLRGKREKVEIRDYWEWKEICFVHGDRDFKEMHKRGVGCWVMGHLHPAVVLKAGVKKEKFKCFLTGKYRGKEVVIVPSFISASEGSDIRDEESNLAWGFNLKKFKVKVVGEGKEVLDFGELGKIKV